MGAKAVDMPLQIWAATCYLSNKILLALAEGKPAYSKRKMKILGWVVFIIGVPAWVIILASKNDWIAAAMEAGGLPAMFLGLYNTVYSDKPANKLFNRLVSIFTICALLLGIFFSLRHYGGLHSPSQFLEILVVLGFLMGSYLLARENIKGWLFFMLMNASAASLMLLHGNFILMAQQIVSLGFVIYGFVQSLKKSKSI